MTSARAFPALLLLALAACADAPTDAPAPAAARPRLDETPNCVEFGPPPPLGASWGGPQGTSPFAAILVEDGIRVFTDRHYVQGGATAYNTVSIVPAPAGLMPGVQAARAQFINVGFSFLGLPFPIQKVRFYWMDITPSANLIVNGSPVFIGDLSAPPATLGGAGIATTWWFGAIGDKWGYTEITAGVDPITSIQVGGGHEFWLDRVCAWH